MKYILSGFIFLATANSLNILQICPGFSQSHIIFNYKLAETLHNAGHNVTILNMILMFGNIRKGNPPTGVTEIRIEPDYPSDIADEVNEAVQDFVFNDMNAARMMRITSVYTNLTAHLCQYTIDQTDLLFALKNNNYDVTLSHFFNLCPLGINEVLKIPKFIWVAPGTFIYDHVAYRMALPNLISYIPYSGGDYSDKMSFVERIKNLFWVVFNFVTSKSRFANFYYENQYFKQFPYDEKFPDLWHLAEQTQALLVNGEDFLDFPRPLIPGLLHIGELGHKNVGKLPEEWENLMENSNNGVILFSLGTIANTSLMPMKLKEAFLEAFSAFDNFTILWRLEGDMPQGLIQQKHIKVVTWTPQNELLNHPKMKLFITHGGYNSLLETVQAGVPMIIMPLFNDQYPNAHRAVRRELGLLLNKLNPDSKVIKDTISRVLYNEKFSNNAKKFSTILKDKFIPNEISMVKFIEKVVHTKSWPTMKTALRLNFVQYYCLDVVAAMFVGVLIAIYCSLKIILCALRLRKEN